MTLVVTGVGFLIHVYSIGYMHGDRGFWRFFTYLNLFIFAMLNLVLADNFLLMFLGWEGVGLCSYLLIGFWYDKKFPGTSITWTGDAANKAFWVNRIGDFAFMLGMFLIFREFGTLTFNEVMGEADRSRPGNSTMFWITLAALYRRDRQECADSAVRLAAGRNGGSHTGLHLSTQRRWLRPECTWWRAIRRLYALAPDTMMIVAGRWSPTAIMAASIGIAQNDIKKVLAYSTVSQLGYMFLALGVGAFTGRHFPRHDARLFQGLPLPRIGIGDTCAARGAGHSPHGRVEENHAPDVLDLPDFELRHRGLSLRCRAFSRKDEILWKAFADGSWVLWLLGAGAALMTAFYMFRMVTFTFEGTPRWGTTSIRTNRRQR
jgi:NADH-quinone oxidoreductase subunit L